MSTPKIITLAGAAGSGKDTLGMLLANRLSYSIDRFAKPLYDFIYSITGATYEELQDQELKNKVIPWIGKSPRQLLQTAGTEWGRNISEDIWARCLEHRNKHILTGEVETGLVIPDGRFPNEAAFTREYDGVLIWVLRPDQEIIKDSGHASENGLRADDCDITVLNNSSIENLHSRLDIIVEAIQAVHIENLRLKERREDAKEEI